MDGAQPRNELHASAGEARTERDRVAAIARASDEHVPATARPSFVVLLAIVALWQAVSWWRTDGYRIADTVEFMEHAAGFVHGQAPVDAAVIRPFGFALLLTPFFVVADWLGIGEPRAIAWSICVLQMALALGLCAVVVRLGTRLAGPRAGWIAGFVAGTNPVFVEYSTQPLSGMAAGLCIGLALDALWEPSDFRRGWRGGLWLAAALLAAYQSLVVLLAILLLVFVRDRAKGASTWRGATAGVLAGVVLQMLLDKLKYGSFGASLGNYVVQNFGGVIASVCLRVGAPGIAKSVYAMMQSAQGLEYTPPLAPEARALQGPWFYFEHAPEMLVWPVLAAFAIGMLRAARRPRWPSSLLALAFAANVLVMSFKGSKDFRLWLPLFPLLAPLVAYGWDWIEQALTRAPHRALLLRALFVVSAAALNARAESARETRTFADYWRAMDFANEVSREIALTRPPGAPVRVAAAYNWAVLMRESPPVELVKLPRQIHRWAQLGAVERAEDYAALVAVDLLITHQPVLTNNPDLFRFVNENFEVRGAVYDPVEKSELGPIYVLARRREATTAPVFFDVAHETSAPSTILEFVRERDSAAKERIRFLGFEYRELPPDRHGWITYRWSADARIGADCTILDRLTSPDEVHAWQNDHVPAYGLSPTSTWKPGDVLTEGYLVVAAAAPYDRARPYQPMGGSYLAGDLVPARLWMKLSGGGERGFEPTRPGEARPIENENRGDGFRTIDGVAFSWDDFVCVGRCFVPVHARAKVASDARTAASIAH